MITEPMTLITDWVLTALCAVFGMRLERAGRARGDRSMRLLAGSFFATAIGAFSGGAAHGFRPHLSDAVNAVTWKVTVLAIGATTLLFVASAAYAALRPGPRDAVLGLAALQALVYSVWMIFHDEFVWVILDYVPAMFLVLGLQLLLHRRGEPSAAWIAAGILTSFVGAAIQAGGLAPHPYFNHNDLYHVVQMAAMWMLYRGGMQLRDRGSTGSIDAAPDTA
jgi:hypothetical protein